MTDEVRTRRAPPWGGILRHFEGETPMAESIRYA